MKTATYEILVLDRKKPVGFQTRIPTKSVVLNVSGKFLEDGGKKWGKIKEIVEYAAEKHDDILNGLVAGKKHVVVHGFTDSQTLSRIFEDLASRGVKFSHLITKDHLDQLNTSEDPKIQTMADLLSRQGFLVFKT
ncbi:MAG TPA: hypothetical protein VI875_01565 [Candidatus Norongarragalinales archaeon]|nr:hypothetical protein [Candidatus Norongarragalinales archaeon]